MGGAGSGCKHPLAPSKQPSVRPLHLPCVPLDVGVHQPALQPADHVGTLALSLQTMWVLLPSACEPWGYPNLLPNLQSVGISLHSTLLAAGRPPPHKLLAVGIPCLPTKLLAGETPT